MEHLGMIYVFLSTMDSGIWNSFRRCQKIIVIWNPSPKNSNIKIRKTSWNRFFVVGSWCFHVWCLPLPIETHLLGVSVCLDRKHENGNPSGSWPFIATSCVTVWRWMFKIHPDAKNHLASAKKHMYVTFHWISGWFVWDPYVMVLW